jgi:hypothetical protein
MQEDAYRNADALIISDFIMAGLPRTHWNASGDNGAMATDSIHWSSVIAT